MAGLMIEREVLIEAPAEVVWRIITEPDQMSQWFADRVELVVEPGAEKQRYADEHWDGWAEYLDRLARILAKRQPR